MLLHGVHIGILRRRMVVFLLVFDRMVDSYLLIQTLLLFLRTC
jgi:hypothetical protein